MNQDSPLQISNALNLPLKGQSTAQLLLQPQAQSLAQPIFQAQKLSAALLEAKPQIQFQAPTQCLPPLSPAQLTTQRHSLSTLCEPQTTNQVSTQSPPTNNCTESSVLQNSTESSILQNSTECSVLQKSNTCLAPSNISIILEKVLNNLERIQAEKNKTTGENHHPEGKH